MKHGSGEDVQSLLQTRVPPGWTFRTAAKDSFYMASIPTEFRGVTAVTKANLYFEGRVASHTLIFPDESRKTLGLIQPAKYHFGTVKAEWMEIVAGTGSVKLEGQTTTRTCGTGQAFAVPAMSGFDVEVNEGVCEYICSFLP